MGHSVLTHFDRHIAYSQVGAHEEQEQVRARDVAAECWAPSGEPHAVHPRPVRCRIGRVALPDNGATAGDDDVGRPVRVHQAHAVWATVVAV